MNMPGFTGEASLSKSNIRDYATGRVSQGYAEALVPQQIRPPRCFTTGAYMCCWYPFSGWWCNRIGGLPE